MVKDIVKFSDTISFYSINIPFKSLFVSYQNIDNFSKDIFINPIEEKEIKSGNLYSNGIKNIFFMNGNKLNILNYENIAVLGKSYRKKTVDEFILNYAEIKKYMEDNNFFPIFKIFSNSFGLNEVNNSNLITYSEVLDNGFKKGETMEVSNIHIVNQQIDIEKNSILNISKLRELFFSKKSSYSIKVKNEDFKFINGNKISLNNVFLSEDYHNVKNTYQYVPKTEEVPDIIGDQTINNLKSDNAVNYRNKKEIEEILEDCIENNSNECKGIFIQNRASNVESNKVVTIEEASTIVDDTFKGNDSINFDSLEAFSDFFKNLGCPLETFVKLDINIPAQTGYLNNKLLSVTETINHKGMKYILNTTGDYDKNEDSPVSNGALYFTNYPAQYKQKIIDICNIFNIEIDFSRNTIGQIYKSICSLITKLSYPTLEEINNLLALKDSGGKLNIVFRLNPPVIIYPYANFSEYWDLAIPQYFKTTSDLIITKPSNLQTHKRFDTYKNINIPRYDTDKNSLNIIPPSIKNIDSKFTANKLNISNYNLINKLLNITPIINSTEKLWGRKEKKVDDKVYQYSISSSNKAINNIEAYVLYKKIKEFLEKKADDLSTKVFICEDSVVSIDIASIILTHRALYRVRNDMDEYPFYINLINIIKELKTDKVTNTIESSEEEEYLDKNFCLLPNINTSENNISSENIVNVNLSEIELKIDNDCLEDHITFLTDNNVDANKMDLSSIYLKDFKANDVIDDIENAFEYIYSKFDGNNIKNIVSDNVYDTYIEYGYVKDWFGHYFLGNRANYSPCDISENGNKLKYFTFVKIEGSTDTTTPKDKETQMEGINSNSVYKGYFINKSIISSKSSVILRSMPYLYVKEKSYIICIGENDYFLYIVEDTKNIYYIRNSSFRLESKISTSEKGNKNYLEIDGANIYVNNSGDYNVTELDTKFTNFDYSFLYKAILEREEILRQQGKDVGVVPNEQGNLEADTLLLSPYSFEKSTINDKTAVFIDIVNNNQNDVSNKIISKSDLKNPINIYRTLVNYADKEVTENDYIPYYFEGVLKLDIYIKTFNSNKEKVIYYSKTEIPIQAGVLDGYKDENKGYELLSLANTKVDADELLNDDNYSFSEYNYMSPKTRHSSIDTIFDDEKSVLNIDLNDYISNASIEPEDLKFYNADGEEIEIQDLKIYLDSDNEDLGEGIYISGSIKNNYNIFVKTYTYDASNPISVFDNTVISAKITDRKEEFENNDNFIKYFFNETETDSGDTIHICSIKLPHISNFVNGIELRAKEYEA